MREGTIMAGFADVYAEYALPLLYLNVATAAISKLSNKKNIITFAYFIYSPYLHYIFLFKYFFI